MSSHADTNNSRVSRSYSKESIERTQVWYTQVSSLHQAVLYMNKGGAFEYFVKYHECHI